MREREFAKLLENLRAGGHDFVERILPYPGGAVHIFFISQLTDRNSLRQDIIKPLAIYCTGAHESICARKAANTLLYADEMEFDTNPDHIEPQILSGMTVILFSTDKEFIIANLRQVEHRSIPEPKLSFTIRGPEDCFTENMNTNLALIRYRVQDPNLKIDYFTVGKRTQTAVAVLYLRDVANETVVNRIEYQLQNIRTDGIGSSGELQGLMQDHPYRLFPQMGIIERSDMAYHILMDGKVLVLANGAPLCIYAPKVFSEYFASGDDRYDNKVFGAFSRILRYLSFIIALTATSIYVAVLSFHTDVLPSDYAILLATLNNSTPFTGLISGLILEFILELLREALLRVPKQIGPAIGIVGAIVIGQAAIAAGIFSAPLLIIAAISLLSSFVMPDYTLITPFRILKFFVILASGFLGFLGFTIACTFILAMLVSTDSYGVPFMAPWAPFYSQDFKKSMIDMSHISKYRPEYLRNKDRKRMR